MTTKQKPILHIGIDWATKKHDVCIQLPDGKRQFIIIDSSPESVDDWIQDLRKRYKSDIHAAVELTRGPIVYALQKYDFVTIYPINPAMLAKYRSAFSPSGAKDDPTDAEIALDLMKNYPSKVPPLQMASEAMRKLAFLVEQRRRLVDDRRRYSNRLNNLLKQYYPQPLSWFSHRNTTLFTDFLIRWPSLKKLQRARHDTIRKFFSKHGGKSSVLTEKRIDAISQSTSLTNDPVVIETHEQACKTLSQQLQMSIEAIKEFDVLIKGIYQEMPDVELFESLPGTGICLGPRLLVAMGEDRNRFKDASEVQMYAGIAPVTERSGKKCWVHWRWQCSKFLRQSFIEWADRSIYQSFWARLYYDQQKAKGSSHQAAIRSLAFKWIRILFKCWKTKTPYSESRYLQTLKDRNSTLIMNI